MSHFHEEELPRSSMENAALMHDNAQLRLLLYEARILLSKIRYVPDRDQWEMTRATQVYSRVTKPEELVARITKELAQ